MSPALVEAKVEQFQTLIGKPQQVGVSEFARSKSWRETLPETGCFEVVDHGDTIGYMLAPDFAEALSEKISELEKQLEKAQIAAIFESRSDLTEAKSGEQLKQEALAYFDANADALIGIINGD